jgi:hypothetical protein
LELFIYIQSPIFNTEFSETEAFKLNKNNLIPFDEINNGLPLQNVSDETIEALIAEHVKNKNPEEFEQTISPFDGGVYLQHEGKIISSNCCGDITNIENWRQLITSTNQHWETMWIGHPEIAYKIDTENIYLSNYINELENGVFSTKFTFNRVNFLKSLQKKLDQFDVFKQQTFLVIAKKNIASAKTLQKLLF